MAASSRPYVMGVSGRFVMDLSINLFYTCSLFIWAPIAFIRFYKAFACDRAVGPTRAFVSISLMRFYCTSWFFLKFERMVTYSFCCARNCSVTYCTVYVHAFSMRVKRAFTASRDVEIYSFISFTTSLIFSRFACIAPDWPWWFMNPWWSWLMDSASSCIFAIRFTTTYRTSA